MSKIKRFKGSIIVLSIFIIAFLATTVKNIFFTRYIHYESILIALVPVILYSISLYIVIKNDKSIKWTRFSNFSNLILFLFLIMTNFFYISFKDSTKSITNAKYYNRILRIYNHEKNPLINHFPSSIPKDASNVEFLEHPQFLQGTAEIYLKYQLPNEELESLEKQLNNNHYKLLNNSWIIENKLEVPEKIKEFSKSISNSKIFLINGEYAENENGSNGNSYGLALNYDDNSVMYWSQTW